MEEWGPTQDHITSRLKARGHCQLKIVSIYDGNLDSVQEAFATGFNCARVLV